MATGLAPTLLCTLLMLVAGCLNLSPASIDVPVADRAPTLDWRTIAPEIGPGSERVNIGEQCADVLFGVADVFDLDAENLSFAFFMLFADPDVDGFARQEIQSGQLLPLDADPTRFQGPILALDREELESEFRFNAVQELVAGNPPAPDDYHVLELVIADRPFVGQDDDDTLPEGAGQVRVPWRFYIVDEDCAVDPGVVE